MPKAKYRKSHRSVFNLTVQMVFITKYRRKIIDLVVSFPPQKRLSDLVGNLKATASKTMWRKFESKLSTIYPKKVFWTSSYFIASCGGVTVDTLKKYVQNQDSPLPTKP